MPEVEETAVAATEESNLDRLEALSREVLKEEFGEVEPTDVSGKPDETGADPAEAEVEKPKEGIDLDAKPEAEKLPGWQRAMPESLRGRLEGMTEEEVAYLRGNAEDGLRQENYSRLTGSLPSKEQLATLVQSHRALQAIQADPQLAVRMFTDPNAEPGDGEDGSSVEELSTKLFEETQPAEFAGTLQKLLAAHGKTVLDQVRSERESRPESKASRVNARAAEIREALGEDYADESWQAACEAFATACSERGGDWRDVNPDQLEFLLSPYIELHRSKPESRSLEAKPEPRAAAIPPSGGGPATKTVDPWEREGREASEDELFDKTLSTFGLTEQELAQLRSRSV